MVLSQECKFCEESIPFYRKLTSHPRSDVQIVVAAPHRDVQIQDYLAGQGVMPDSVVHVDFGAFPVPGTPTLLRVDQTGLVTHRWIGLLSPERENDVIDVVFS